MNIYDVILKRLSVSPFWLKTHLLLMNGLVAVVLIIVQNESKRKASEHFESSHLCSSVSRCLYSTQKIKFSIKNLFI